MSKHPYIILNETITQPVSRRSSISGTFVQRIKILVPGQASNAPKVFFILGNEAALDDKILGGLFEAYGSRTDMVLLTAEHRGYGRSIPAGDQSVPSYVTIAEALEDYHTVRQCYAQRFPGPWIIAGYSYGGGLAIAYAHANPDDGAVVLSSSGVVTWNAMLPEYDLAVRENLGPQLYVRLCAHVDRLSPAEPFSENWYARELIYAFVTGLCQFQQYQALLGFVSALAGLPTPAFIAALKTVDGWFAGNGAKHYADSNCARTLSNAQAQTGHYSWRIWRYQQACECGTYWAPAGQPSLYRRSKADWNQECRLLFGLNAPIFERADWKVRRMVNELKPPLIYVRGEKDPWRRVGLEPEFALNHGQMISFPGGFHCPDRTPEYGMKVIQALLSFL
jgi:pimeloyl-ACP methyl ester carboxylesterase